MILNTSCFFLCRSELPEMVEDEVQKYLENDKTDGYEDFVNYLNKNMNNGNIVSEEFALKLPKGKENEKQDNINVKITSSENLKRTENITNATYTGPDHTIDIRGKGSGIDIPPYKRCFNNSKRFFAMKLLLSTEDTELNCFKDQLKTEINGNRCAVFPACNVSWEGENPQVNCDRNLVVATTVFNFIISFLIVGANMFIIVVFTKTKSLRNPQGLFKISLACSGILLGGIYLPSSGYNLLTTIQYNQTDSLLVFGQVSTYHEVHFNNILKIAGLESSKELVSDLFKPSNFIAIVAIVQSIVNVYSLLLLAFDRYLSVRWPVQYRVGELMTKNKTLILILIKWLFAFTVSICLVFASPHFYSGRLLTTFTDFVSFDAQNVSSTISSTPSTNNETEDLQLNVFKMYWHSILFAVVVWIIPFLLTWIFTIMLLVRSQTMLNRMRSSRRRSSKGKKLHNIDRSLVLTIAVLLVLFTLLTFPLFAVILHSAFNEENQWCLSPFSAIGIFVSFYLYAFSSFANLLVYNVFQKDFRKAAFAILRGSRHKRVSSFKSNTSKRSLSTTLSNTISSRFQSLKSKTSTRKAKRSGGNTNLNFKKEQLPAARVNSNASNSTKSSELSNDST